MKSTLLLFAAMTMAAPGGAAFLPGVIGTWKQVSTGALEVQTNRPLWDEYGLRGAEQGVYKSANGEITVQAWRLADSTTAMGAFEYVKPADARSAPQFEGLTPNAALLPSSGALVALGNYLVRFEGQVPEADAVANLFRSMSRYENAGLPTFPGYLPPNRVPNSERYIGGPAALREFFPGISASAAGFHLGAEAMVADYKPDQRLALFSYPTPAIARDRQAEFSRIPGVLVKRSGPLVALVLRSKDENAAEGLLSQIRYRAVVTTGEKPATKKDNAGNLLLNVFYLIVILTGFCLASGLLFGLLRMAFRRSGSSGGEEELLALHLERR